MTRFNSRPLSEPAVTSCGSAGVAVAGVGLGVADGAPLVFGVVVVCVAVLSGVAEVSVVFG